MVDVEKLLEEKIINLRRFSPRDGDDGSIFMRTSSFCKFEIKQKMENFAEK
jgi:hypothetical protein